MKNYKISYSIRIDEDIHAKIKYISEIERRSLNSQIEYAIEQFIKQYEKEKGEILLPPNK